jgi:hypothetical protein
LTTSFVKSGRKLSSIADPLEAELFASIVISMLEADPADPPDRRLALVDRLLDALADRRDRGSLPVALALASVLPEPWAGHARAVADGLVAAGSAVPPWTLAVGRARFVEGWAMTDEFGDQDLIVATFKHPGQPPHSFSITADHNFNGLFRQVGVGIDAELVRRTWDEISPIPLRAITAQDLATRWAAGTLWYRRYLDPPVYDDVPPLMALVEARASALPVPAEPPEFVEVSAADRVAVIERFLASTAATSLQPTETTTAVLENLIDFRQNHGEGDLLRWSPIVVEIALADWLPRKAVLSDAEIDALPDILRAYVRFAASEKGLADDDLLETLDAIDEFAPTFLDLSSDADSFGMGKRIALQMQADGVDMTDQAALSAWLEAFNARPIAERDDILGPLPPV